VTQLLLPGPYGYDAFSFASISLYARDDIDPEQVTGALKEFGCYPPAVPKILQCLKYSGRYDCRVQRGWLVSQWKMAIRQFAVVGVMFIVNRVVDFDRDKRLEEVWEKCLTE
jgi:hypothetical protein